MYLAAPSLYVRIPPLLAAVGVACAIGWTNLETCMCTQAHSSIYVSTKVRNMYTKLQVHTGLFTQVCHVNSLCNPHTASPAACNRSQQVYIRRSLTHILSDGPPGSRCCPRWDAQRYLQDKGASMDVDITTTAHIFLRGSFPLGFLNMRIANRDARNCDR